MLDPRPGDLVLLSGRSVLHKRFQGLLHSKWGQAALIVRLPDHGLCILECTSKPSCPSIETGFPASGVHTTRLEERIKSFDGEFGLRRLCPAISPEQMDRLDQFRIETVGRPFDMEMGTTRRALHRSNTTANFVSFLCSAYVAAAYQRIGVLEAPPGGPLHTNVLPTDFAGTGVALPFRGFSLGPIEPLGQAEMAAGD